MFAVFEAPQIIYTIASTGLTKARFFSLTRVVKKLLSPLSTEVSIKHHLLASQHLQWVLNFSCAGRLRSLWEPCKGAFIAARTGSVSRCRRDSSLEFKLREEVSHTEPLAARHRGSAARPGSSARSTDWPFGRQQLLTRIR